MYSRLIPKENLPQAIFLHQNTGFCDSNCLLDRTHPKGEESTYGDCYIPCEICAVAFCPKEVGLPVTGRWLGGQAAYAV